MDRPLIEREHPPALPPPPAPQATPIPVLAEGTAPAAILYRAPVASARHRWPWIIVALGVLAGIAIVVVAFARRDDRAALLARYPVTATTSEADALAAGHARWAKGARSLVTSLAAFEPPDLSSLKGVGACPLATGRTADELARATTISYGDAPATDDADLAISLRHLILPGETTGDLAAVARPEIAQLLAAAERARFQTVAGKQHVLHAVAGAFVLVRVDEARAPELDRARDSIVPGVLAGTAYAFDPATGALRCAGTFRAASPGTPTTLSAHAGLDRAREAAILDFEREVERSIVASLRAID